MAMHVNTRKSERAADRQCRQAQRAAMHLGRMAGGTNAGDQGARPAASTAGRQEAQRPAHVDMPPFNQSS